MSYFLKKYSGIILILKTTTQLKNLIISLQIPKPKNGRRFAIADVHGCAHTLAALVQKIGLEKDDQLFLLGDYIDRGKDSAGVLDFIMNLESNGFQVFALKGNHEDMFLEEWQLSQQASHTFKSKTIFLRLMKFNKAEKLLDENQQPKLRYLNFMENLYYYFELPDFYLVHAGFNFQTPDFKQDLRSMLWIRNFAETEISFEQTKGKRIVVGHSIHDLGTIKQKIAEKSLIIPLDNGCYYGAKNPIEVYEGHYANLCCLNLDTFELITQSYIG